MLADTACILSHNLRIMLGLKQSPNRYYKTACLQHGKPAMPGAAVGRSINLNVLQTALTVSGSLSAPQLRIRDMEELEADVQEVVRLLNNTNRNVTRRCLLQLLSSLQTVRAFISEGYSITAGGLCSQVSYAYTRVAVFIAFSRISSALLCSFQGFRCHSISCVLHTDY